MRTLPPYPFYLLYGMTREVDLLTEKTLDIGPDSPYPFRSGTWQAGRDGWLSHGIIILPDELQGVLAALIPHKGDYTITEVKSPPTGQNIDGRIRAIQKICTENGRPLPEIILNRLTGLFTEQFDPHRIGNWSINFDKGGKK